MKLHFHNLIIREPGKPGPHKKQNQMKFIFETSQNVTGIITAYARVKNNDEKPDEKYEVTHYWKPNRVELFTDDHTNVIEIGAYTLLQLADQIKELINTEFRTIPE